MGNTCLTEEVSGLTVIIAYAEAEQVRLQTFIKTKKYLILLL